MKFSQIHETSREVADTRDTLRPKAVEAIREMGTRLREALDGEPLRGLHNLAGSATYIAVRVRGKSDKRFPGPDAQKGEREFLCLNAKGELVMVWWEDVGSDVVEIRDRPVRDDELIARDVQDLLDTIQYVIPRHIERAKRAKARYEKMSLLVEVLRGAFRLAGKCEKASAVRHGDDDSSQKRQRRDAASDTD